MQSVHTFLGRAMFGKQHLIECGLVDSKPQIPVLIKNGILPPPYKKGEAAQARVWWSAEDVERAFAIVRERSHRVVVDAAE